MQQVKARDKTIRSLQKQLEDFDFRQVGLALNQPPPAESEESINQKIEELEHYIDILEQEHDNVVIGLETKLDDANKRIKEFEESTQSESSSAKHNVQSEFVPDASQYNEMRTSLLEAEAEIRGLEDEFRYRVAELEDVSLSICSSNY